MVTTIQQIIFFRIDKIHKEWEVEVSFAYRIWGSGLYYLVKSSKFKNVGIAMLGNIKIRKLYNAIYAVPSFLIVYSAIKINALNVEVIDYLINDFKVLYLQSW